MSMFLTWDVDLTALSTSQLWTLMVAWPSTLQTRPEPSTELDIAMLSAPMT